VKSGLLLDVVVRKGSSVLELFPGKDQSLLVRRDALLILDFSLHVVDGVRRFNIQGDRLTRQSFDKDLHSSSKAEH